MQTFALASFSSALPWFALNPIDVAKLRLQVQGELVRDGYVRKSIMDLVKELHQGEGVKGLYRGFSQVFLLTQLNALRLTLYDVVKQTELPRILNASLVGAFIGWLSSPVQMIKTRLMCGSNDTARAIFRTMIQQRIVFKNSVLNAGRSAFTTIIQLPTFDYFLRRNYSSETQRLAISSFSATLAWVTLSQPLDMLLTRLYNGQNNVYTSMVKGILLIMRTEGIRGLYKGYFAFFLTMGPASFTQLLIFQYLKESLS